MPQFKPGERVNVTIANARIAADDGTTVKVTYGDGKYLIPLADDTTNVTIDRVTPDVQSGDLWRDRNNYLWFVRGDLNGETPPMVSTPVMVPVNGGEYGMPEMTPGEWIQRFGPVTLSFRAQVITP